MYIKIPVTSAARITTGGPLVTIASESKDGVADVMTAAWNCPYDRDQVLVVLDLGHTTVRNILDTGRFVLGIPDKSQVKQTLIVGSAHGRDTGDKFEKYALPFKKSAKLGIKVLPDQLAYAECELADRETFEKTGVLIGKAVNLYVRDSMWNAEEECFLDGAHHTLHHLKDNVFLSADQVLRA